MTSVAALRDLVQQHTTDPTVQFNSKLHNTFFQKFLFAPNFPAVLSELLEGKTVTFLRHAQSHINVYMSDPDNFLKPYPKNPELYDPGITVRGAEQCQNFPPSIYNIVYVSPLKRTLQTYEHIQVLSDKLVITPLIRQRNRIRAAVVGTTVDRLRRQFPALKFDEITQEFWWRHDYVEDGEKGLRRENDVSFEARVAFFFIMALLEGSREMLIISHSILFERLHGQDYFQRPENCKPYLIEHKAIQQLFRRIFARISPKL